MRWVKLAVLLLTWPLFFIAVALAHVGISLFRLPGRWRRISRLTQAFASVVRTTLNVKVAWKGDRDRLDSGGFLVVSNHLGYLDGIVLGSLFPIIYVSKLEVRGWPLIGQWTALCGTIFVDRKRKDKIPLLVEEIDRKLKEANVLLFPEGTSTNGERLLPFQSAPFAAPLRARAAIVPVTLTYRRVNGQPVDARNRDLIYWYGDMEFASHFWGLLGLKSVEVTVRVHPKIETSGYSNNSLSRKELSQACYDAISGKPGDKDFPERNAAGQKERVKA